MDTFALGYKIALKLIEDGRIDKFVEDRYASWKTGIGADIISGKATMADLEKYALEKGEVVDSLCSGRQEMLESIKQTLIKVAKERKAAKEAAENGEAPNIAVTNNETAE